MKKETIEKIARNILFCFIGLIVLSFIYGFVVDNWFNEEEQKLIIHDTLGVAINMTEDEIKFIGNSSFTTRKLSNEESCEIAKKENPDKNVECLIGNITKIEMFKGLEETDGFIENAIYSYSYFINDKLELVYFGKAEFVTSESFLNQSECTKVKENNIAEYYCEKHKNDEFIIKYSSNSDNGKVGK